MRKNPFNRLVARGLEKLIGIALIFVVATEVPVSASPQDIVSSPLVACPVPTALTPVWGKLVIKGDTVTCYFAKGIATPNKWTQVGSAETIDFINDPLLIGMYVTSCEAGTIGSGTIDNFSISPAPIYRLTDYDIGAPPLMGSANLIKGVWNLAGSGIQMWDNWDQCNFQSWLVWGDCTVICRITSCTGNYFQRMGIMIRDGFNSGSDCAFFTLKKSGGVAFEYRYSFFNNPDITEFVAPPAPGVKSSVAVGYGLTGGTSYTVRP